MKQIAAISLALILLSCFSKKSDTEKIDELNRRVSFLEQKIDSLTGGTNLHSEANANTYGLTRFGIISQSGRCQAITKKGIQCRRKQRSNGYCWQHAAVR